MLLQGLPQRWPGMPDPLQTLLASPKNEARTGPAPAPQTGGGDQLALYLGVMKLHRVICRKGHHEALPVEVRQWIFCILQEEAVVAEWGHSNGNLGKEVQILQHRGLQR